MSSRYYSNPGEPESSTGFVVGIVVACAVALILFIGLILLLTHRHTVPAGWVGVQDSWGNVNANQQVLQQGTSWVTPGNEVHDVNVQPQNFAFKEVEAPGSDGQAIFVDAAVNYQVSDRAAAQLYINGGAEHILSAIVAPTVTSDVKQVIVRYSIVPNLVDKSGVLTPNALYLANHRPEVQQAIDKAVTETASQYGIKILRVNLTNFHGDATFQKSVEETAIAQQHQAQATAEGQAKVAAAEAEARANLARQSSLTPEQIQWALIQKWTGQQPITIGGGAIVNLPPPK